MATSDPSYVQKQIKHMLAFIEQEASEKADEIDSKAEEEFNLGKGQLVTDARQKINEEFEKREKQIELQRKIQGSKMLNASRLQVLKNKEQHISEVIEETQKLLSTVTEKPDQYRTLVEKLLLQGLLQLVEENVIVRCRKADVALVEQLKNGVLQMYKQKVGKTCNVEIDKTNFLNDRCGGGVELYARNGKIMVANTLEKRLEQVSSQLMPQIRNKLFGSNPNRKFLD